MSSNTVLFSNDVETTSIWLNTLRNETGERVLHEGMPYLLDLYDKYSIKSTFYYTYYIAKLYPKVVKMAVNAGHEIASHGKSHLKENGFDVMPFERQKRHLIESKKLLEDISGQEVVNFRAPALRVNQDTAPALIDAGFKIDSSVSSQRFDFFLSFGGGNKLKWLTAPRLAYKTSPMNIFKKGDGPLVEVPVSAMVIPYIGTTMRLMPSVTELLRYFIYKESKITGKPVVFLIHPNELIDESDLPRTVERRSSNPIKYFLQDWLRSNLKVKNLGKPGVDLYENQISFFTNNDFRGITIKQYCQEHNLI